MRWLVTGGAGYVGSHVVDEALRSGHDVVVLDDLSTGVLDRVPQAAAFVHGDVSDPLVVAEAVRGVDVVVHVAAKKQVGESTQDPLLYYRENVGGLQVLLEQCRTAGIGRFVFSSSAATYGVLDAELLEEDMAVRPVSPYGSTKLVGEWMVQETAAAYGMSVVCLRYFNVAGAARPELGDPWVLNLVPIVFRALDEGRRPVVFGTDYPTPDGTCLRDYVHPSDIARAHLLAGAATVEPGQSLTCNIGRGVGSSVLEVLRAIGEITGLDTSYDVTGRRSGDPASLVAAVDRARQVLGFEAQHDLRSVVSSAWEAWQVRRSAAG